MNRVPSSAEQEFQWRLDEFGRECRSAVALVYTQVAFDHWVGLDLDLNDRIQPHGHFWTRVMGGLQSAAFAALGRIYDSRSDTRSGASLLAFAAKNVGMFRPEALKARRVRAGSTIEAAAEFARGTADIRTGGLDHLRAEFDHARSIYDAKIAPIRHDVYAHAGNITADERNKLFDGLMKREFETAAVLPLRLHRALAYLFSDGLEPTLSSVTTNIADVVKELPGANTSTWEHLHAAADVRAFLDWMNSVPLDE